MKRPASFVVNYTCVVNGAPDLQAQREYTQHFGKLDMKDLKRRYRAAQWEAERATKATTAAKATKYDFQSPTPSILVARATLPTHKRTLVQSTIDWKAVSTPPAPPAIRCPG